MGGFDRPILHGLCSYGFTGRALLQAVCDGDPARFAGMEARFSSPVMPGEALTVKTWREGDGAAIFPTCGDDGRVVIGSGRVTFTSLSGTDGVEPPHDRQIGRASGRESRC